MDLLDRARLLIDKRREQTALLDDLARSVFYGMFGDPVRNEKGWEMKEFHTFCESRLGKMLDKKQIDGKNLRPYLRNANVQWFKI